MERRTLLQTLSALLVRPVQPESASFALPMVPPALPKHLLIDQEHPSWKDPRWIAWKARYFPQQHLVWMCFLREHPPMMYAQDVLWTMDRPLRYLLNDGSSIFAARPIYTTTICEVAAPEWIIEYLPSGALPTIVP